MRWTSRGIARASRPTTRRIACSVATNGIDGVLKANRLDAILTPGGGGRRACGARRLSDHRRAVRTGAERADAAVPERLRCKPGPFGVGFTGTACSEPRLIELAYTFEQATKKRVSPASTP